MRAILSLVIITALAGVGCAAAGPGDGSDGSIAVVASSYPMAHAAERVGGASVTVTDLTPPGTEPHDLELTPDDLETIATADVVVFAGGGFQPAVQDAIAAEASGIVVDALDGVELLVAGEGEDDPAADPHVWLDPSLYADLVDRVAAALGDADPRAAGRYTDAASAFRAELEALDADFREGLAGCRSRLLVTNHAAFGYLAAAYGLEQRAISGLSPESEPDPARIAELAAEVEARGVTTIFTEDLVSPEVAETLAAEAGIATDVLSPLEGLTRAQEAGDQDYVSVMRENLETLRDGLDCT
jgi:zinc transport system substrate-binding protein